MLYAGPPVEPIIWEFDHLAVQSGARDPGLAGAIALLGLKSGERPAFPFPGAWFYGDVQGRRQALMHLIELPQEHAICAFDHIAFRAKAPFQLVMRQVRATGLPHQVRLLPDRSAAQIFVALSAGLMLELDVPCTEDAEQFVMQNHTGGQHD